MTYSTIWDDESSFGMNLPGNHVTPPAAPSVEIPEIYARTDAVKEPQSEIIAQSPPGVDKSMGFNPYDTGVLQHKKFRD